MLENGTGKERFATFPQESFEVSGLNGPQLLRELNKTNRIFGPWAVELLNSLQKPESPERISVVKFRLRDVGVRNRVSGMPGWNTIVAAVRNEGIELCPNLTAPELAHVNTKIIGYEEYVTVLSQPIVVRGRQGIFALASEGGFQLRGGWALGSDS